MTPSYEVGAGYPCPKCAWECESDGGLEGHLRRHNFVAQLPAHIMVCWFCGAYMAERGVGGYFGGAYLGIAWSIPERINHIVGCYERWWAGADLETEETRRRTEMVMAR